MSKDSGSLPGICPSSCSSSQVFAVCIAVGDTGGPLSCSRLQTGHVFSQPRPIPQPGGANDFLLLDEEKAKTFHARPLNALVVRTIVFLSTSKATQHTPFLLAALGRSQVPMWESMQRGACPLPTLATGQEETVAQLHLVLERVTWITKYVASGFGRLSNTQMKAS